MDLQDWDDAGASFSPSPLIPLPSRERGIPPHCHPVDSRLRGNDGRPALPLWVADQVRDDVGTRELCRISRRDVL